MKILKRLNAKNNDIVFLQKKISKLQSENKRLKSEVDLLTDYVNSLDDMVRCYEESIREAKDMKKQYDFLYRECLKIKKALLRELS